jgi:hypothetical protein
VGTGRQKGLSCGRRSWSVKPGSRRNGPSQYEPAALFITVNNVFRYGLCLAFFLESRGVATHLGTLAPKLALKYPGALPPELLMICFPHARFSLSRLRHSFHSPATEQNQPAQGTETDIRRRLFHSHFAANILPC